MSKFYNNISSVSAARNALQYEWSADKAGNIREHEQEARAGSSKIEAHYNAKKNTAVIMTKPQELDDSEGDDDADIRPTKQTLHGMVIPYMYTSKGTSIISY